VEAFGVVRGADQRQFTLCELIVVDSAALNDGQRLNRLGGGTDVRHAFRIADRIEQLAVGIDNGNITVVP
jgi:hypothetical protein